MDLIDLAQEAGLEPKWVAGTEGGEYHSACPACGGEDRFVIHPNKKTKNCCGHYWCRQCGINGDSIQFCKDFLELSFPDAVERVGATLSENSNVQNFLKTKHQNKNQTHFTALKPPSQAWVTKASSVVKEAHEQLLLQPQILLLLEKRGLPLEAVKNYKLGWVNSDTWCEGSDWGLEKERVWLPKGIVIPTMQKPMVVRIKIRRHDYRKNDEFPKYMAISGSMNGLNIIGDITLGIMIVVESELDANALHHLLKDLAVIVAVGSNMKNPDNVTDSLAKQKKILLIAHDNDNAGKAMLTKWQDIYKHAKGLATPIGKDIGEAIENGFDVKSWILEKISKHSAYTQTTQSALPKPSCTMASIPTNPIIEKKEPIQPISQPLVINKPQIVAYVENSFEEQVIAAINKTRNTWGNDQALIDWFLNAFKKGELPQTPIFLPSVEYGDENISSPAGYYICLQAAIANGPLSWEAKTKRLQDVLQRLKIFIEQKC